MSDSAQSSPEERPPFPERAEFHVLVVGSAPFVEKRRGRTYALAGATLSDAYRLLAERPHADSRTSVEVRPAAELRHWLRECGADHLAFLDGTVRFEHALAEVTTDPVVLGNACPLVMMVEAGNRPQRDDESNREVLRMRRASIQSGASSPLLFDTWFACDQDVYVPCHSEMIAREMWPRFELRDGPQGARPATFQFYTSPEAAARCAGAGGRVVALGGLEALRWAFAAPVEFDSIVVDPGTPDAAHIGRGRVVAALFRSKLPFDDPRSVPSEDIGGLTEHGPHLEGSALVLGSLVSRWSQLIGPTGDPKKGEPAFAFSSRAALASAVARPDLMLPAGLAQAQRMPYRTWIAHACSAGKLVIDPASSAPLELDPVDLFLLAQWAEHGHSIDAEQLVDDLGRLVELGQFDATWAARALAEWPDWVVGEGGQERDSNDTRPWIATSTGALALFSSEARLGRFVERERAQGRLRGPWRARAFTQSVGHDLFQVARDEYDGCAVDPGRTQLELDRKALKFAVNAVNDRLWPGLLRARRRSA